MELLSTKLKLPSEFLMEINALKENVKKLQNQKEPNRKRSQSLVRTHSLPKEASDKNYPSSNNSKSESDLIYKENYHDLLDFVNIPKGDLKISETLSMSNDFPDLNDSFVEKESRKSRGDLKINRGSVILPNQLVDLQQTTKSYEEKMQTDEAEKSVSPKKSSKSQLHSPDKSAVNYSLNEQQIHDCTSCIESDFSFIQNMPELTESSEEDDLELILLGDDLIDIDHMEFLDDDTWLYSPRSEATLIDRDSSLHWLQQSFDTSPQAAEKIEKAFYLRQNAFFKSTPISQPSIVKRETFVVDKPLKKSEIFTTNPQSGGDINAVPKSLERSETFTFDAERRNIPSIPTNVMSSKLMSAKSISSKRLFYKPELHKSEAKAVQSISPQDSLDSSSEFDEEPLSSLNYDKSVERQFVDEILNNDSACFSSTQSPGKTIDKYKSFKTFLEAKKKLTPTVPLNKKQATKTPKCTKKSFIETKSKIGKIETTPISLKIQRSSGIESVNNAPNCSSFRISNQYSNTNAFSYDANRSTSTPVKARFKMETKVPQKMLASNCVAQAIPAPEKRIISQKTFIIDSSTPSNLVKENTLSTNDARSSFNSPKQNSFCSEKNHNKTTPLKKSFNDSHSSSSPSPLHPPPPQTSHIPVRSKFKSGIPRINPSKK